MSLNRFIAWAIFVSISLTQGVAAACSGRMILPTTDLSWMSMLPIKLGGVPVLAGGDGVNAIADMANTATCTCPMPSPPYVRIGITLGYFEPFKIIEVVKEPFCFPSFGFGLGGGYWNTKGTSTVQLQGTNNYTGYTHFIIFPVGMILGAVVDSLCLEANYDAAINMLTELNPVWNDGELASIYYPEGLLYANPGSTIVASVANAVLCFTKQSNPVFHWQACGTSTYYPLSGQTASNNPTTASMQMAGKALYANARYGGVCDPGVYWCSCVPTPIPVWTNYKFQIARPIPELTSHPSGQTGLFWAYGKNPPTPQGDNFAYIVFRRRTCCVY